DNLVFRSEFFIEIPKQIFLCFAVKSKARLVKQQNQITSSLLNLSELHQERKEPYKASTALRKWKRQLVEIVLHPRSGDNAVIERRRVSRFCLGHANFKFNVGVLRPVFQQLCSDMTRGCFAACVQTFVSLSSRDFVQVRSRVLKKID